MTAQVGVGDIEAVAEKERGLQSDAVLRSGVVAVEEQRRFAAAGVEKHAVQLGAVAGGYAYGTMRL